MLINEIFKSIDGEGNRTGYPVTFIRSFGCNCACTYCDTMYAVQPETEEDKANAFKEMSVDEIVQKCKDLGTKRITFTGGEPLIQKDAVDLVGKLMLNGFEVNIETNGAVNIEEFTHKLDAFMDMHVQEYMCVAGSYYYTLDYKCPTSGMEDKMILSNLDWLSKSDVLKFVVGSKEDLDRMKQIITEHDIYAEVFVSPVFGKIDPKDIVQYIIENDLQNVRVQLQLHKIIWDFNQRGV